MLLLYHTSFSLQVLFLLFYFSCFFFLIFSTFLSPFSLIYLYFYDIISLIFYCFEVVFLWLVFLGFNRNQSILFCLDDYISDNNPVRVIDAFVNGLNLEELGFLTFKSSAPGQQPFSRSDLLKLHIYGYMNGIRSSVFVILNLFGLLGGFLLLSLLFLTS